MSRSRGVSLDTLVNFEKKAESAEKSFSDRDISSSDKGFKR